MNVKNTFAGMGLALLAVFQSVSVDTTDHYGFNYHLTAHFSHIVRV
jgi:hypothetical protein